MKNLKKNALLPGTVLLLGIAAGLLRRALYAVALDGKGLLIPRHPLSAALWGLVLVGCLLILWSVRRAKGAAVYADNFGPAPLSALSHSFMACAVALLALNGYFSLPGMLRLVWKLLGFLSAPALVWAGLCRKNGRKPFFGIYAALCLFLLLYLVSCYQLWSGNPQVLDYVFELLALVALVLFSYQQAAFAAGIGKRRQQLTVGLLAVLLCGAAAPWTQLTVLYTGGALWALSDLCRLDPPPEKDEGDAYDPA